MLHKAEVPPTHPSPPAGPPAGEQHTRAAGWVVLRPLLVATPLFPKAMATHLTSDSTSLFLVTFYPVYSIPVTKECSCKCMYGGCCYKAAIYWIALILRQTEIITVKMFSFTQRENSHCNSCKAYSCYHLFLIAHLSFLLQSWCFSS